MQNLYDADPGKFLQLIPLFCAQSESSAQAIVQNP